MRLRSKGTLEILLQIQILVGPNVDNAINATDKCTNYKGNIFEGNRECPLINP